VFAGADGGQFGRHRRRRRRPAARRVAIVGEPRSERFRHARSYRGVARLPARTPERALRSDAERNQRRVWSAQDLSGEMRACLRRSRLLRPARGGEAVYSGGLPRQCALRGLRENILTANRSVNSMPPTETQQAHLSDTIHFSRWLRFQTGPIPQTP
jgi:hypothetical protein